MQEILINIEAGERRVAVLREGKLEWYFVERVSGKRIVGNIYKAKVSSVLNGMGAAFIDCGLGKNGFLYVSDLVSPVVGEDFEDGLMPPVENVAIPDKDKVKITDMLKKDQDIMVQIVKEGIGTKGPRLTSQISLAGRYLVLMPSLKRIGVSRKIRDNQERQRIKKILQSLKLPSSVGVVARTAASGYGKKEFQKDSKYLIETYKKINGSYQELQAPSLLFEELDLSLSTIRDFLNEETKTIVVDDKAEYNKIRQFVNNISSGFSTKIRFHTEELSLFEKFGLEKEIDKLFERKIYLKCGGYIIIEQTEGMITIDVNSGKFTGKKNLEETVFKVNCEAAQEIARQLRLRDAGGIVVIDFIDMHSQEHRRELFSTLENSLKKDKAKTNIISLSELDIVEMTRQRVRRSLESVSYRSCSHCEGRGIVKSSETMVITALRKLNSFLKTNRLKRAPIELIVHPDIAGRLVNQDAASLDILRKKFKKQITVVSDDSLHIEDVKIAFVQRGK
ncbi:MAG: Rne/Rng family ribonuclease [Candidatus Omnitrophota bacterium]